MQSRSIKLFILCVLILTSCHSKTPQANAEFDATVTATDTYSEVPQETPPGTLAASPSASIETTASVTQSPSKSPINSTSVKTDTATLEPSPTPVSNIKDNSIEINFFNITEQAEKQKNDDLHNDYRSFRLIPEKGIAECIDHKVRKILLDNGEITEKDEIHISDTRVTGKCVYPIVIIDGDESKDRKYYSIDLDSSKCIKLFEGFGSVYSLAGTSKVMYFNVSREVFIFDEKTQKSHKTNIDLHNIHPMHFLLSKKGDYIYMAGNDAGKLHRFGGDCFDMLCYKNNRMNFVP